MISPQQRYLQFLVPKDLCSSQSYPVISILYSLSYAQYKANLTISRILWARCWWFNAWFWSPYAIAVKIWTACFLLGNCWSFARFELLQLSRICRGLDEQIKAVCKMIPICIM
ncbi:hypothetical protein CIPAW_06G073400 [Carya illinoinensis]|uniref:Uncharacterized protein n=1 Tax=Carya illinoinensis TaxID=32201 RepID=A0A8T1Q901_CARIL|nr:hypothetical protein CIPAW_06G073400 [Carya illinoinensis]